MNERGHYVDPSRDPNATPLVGARWDRERGQWVSSSDPADQPNLPVVRPESSPGLVFRETRTHEYSLDGELLPVIAGLFQSALQATQQPMPYSPEQTANTTHVEQIQPGWDTSPTDGPFARRAGTSETKQLSIAGEALTDSGAPIDAKEKTRRPLPVRLLIAKCALAVGIAQVGVAGGAFVSGAEHPEWQLYKYTNPAHDIQNFSNWGPVKLVTKIGGVIIPN